MSRKQTAESFWARVNRENDGCWEWQGTRNNTGYGVVGWAGKNYTAHRVAAWVSGMVDSPSVPVDSRALTHVLHTCDNRRCCNPSHFFLGSYSNNQRDAYTKKRRVQPTGANHVNAKLTAEQAKEIRNRYRDGERQIPLAKEYGVSQRAISKMVRMETYK